MPFDLTIGINKFATRKAVCKCNAAPLFEYYREQNKTQNVNAIQAINKIAIDLSPLVKIAGKIPA